MRKIKNNVMLILALLPLSAYLFSVFRLGEVTNFLEVVQAAFGDFGAFFEPILTPLLTEFVSITDAAGVELVSWIIGYYVTFLLAYILYELFTFVITFFMNKIDNIKGGA